MLILESDPVSQQITWPTRRQPAPRKSLASMPLTAGSLVNSRLRVRVSSPALQHQLSDHRRLHPAAGAARLLALRLPQPHNPPACPVESPAEGLKMGRGVPRGRG